MIVGRGCSDFMRHAPGNCRAAGTDECDQSVWFLAGESEVGGPFDLPAVHAVSRHMTVCQKRQGAETRHTGLADFHGRKILLVDDDRRNLFALTSVLESRGISVLHAENGKAGVDVLQGSPDIDLVLMDTMMPHMDGIEATESIRKIPRFKNLPIISLTAKAMKGDREKCLAAGASDYVTKPVDPDRLLAFIHLWLNNTGK